MPTVILDGGKHGSEHFKFDELPTRIKIQTKAKGGGMYSRGRNVVFVYQDTGQYSGGCRVYTYVRSIRTLIQGYLEVEH